MMGGWRIYVAFASLFVIVYVGIIVLLLAVGRGMPMWMWCLIMIIIGTVGDLIVGMIQKERRLPRPREES